MEGLTLSVTVMENVHGALTLLQESLAVQITGVIPAGKVDPEGGTQVITGDGSQLSVAVTGKLTTEPPVPEQGTVMGDGQLVITGGVSSSTVMVWLRLCTFPQTSVA